MATKIALSVTFEKPADASARAISRGTKDGLIAAGKRWHRQFMPLHFTSQAQMRYGYKLRTAKYQRYKAKKKHHQNALVWTGDTMRTMKGQTPTITARGKKAFVRYTGINPYFLARLKNQNQPDKAREVTWVAEGECEALAEVFNLVLMRELAKKKKPRGSGAKR